MELGEPFDEPSTSRPCARRVDDVVRRQVEAGIDVVSDGEMGKSTGSRTSTSASGARVADGPLESPSVLPPSRDRQAFPGFYAEHDAQFDEANREALGRPRPTSSRTRREPEGKVWVCTGPISYDETALQRDIANLKARSAGSRSRTRSCPVVAPASAYWLRNEHYETDEEFVFALADAMREEYKAIVDAGFMLQVDDAVLIARVRLDPVARRLLRGLPRAGRELRVDALNHALAGLPEDRVRYHVCWGSWHGPHAFDPPLRDVVDLVLQVNARPTRSSRPTRGTSTSGASGRTSSCPTARC